MTHYYLQWRCPFQCAVSEGICISLLSITFTIGLIITLLLIYRAIAKKIDKNNKVKE